MLKDRDIIGKYLVTDQIKKVRQLHILTDNPREAVWEANKYPNRRNIENIQGDREFYIEDGRWKQKRVD